MKTPLSWIKEYVPGLDVTSQEYTDAMTLSGTKVEGYEELDKNLDNIIVGKILKIEKHPDADKLIICQVDVGRDNPVQIVTGATNVKEGNIVPVVLEGGKVAGGHDGTKDDKGIKIKKGKLRGVESFGMLCSIEELGSNKEMYPDAPEDGIYIFSDDTQIGADAIEILGLHDTVFEYEVTSNRVDCFSILGIAREVAATFNKDYVPPTVEVKSNNEDASNYISVEVKDKLLCPRFCARVIKNVQIKPSPKWMQQRLASLGIRPINNLVDITNYVMEEYGQPMHAYDLSTIEDKKIIVRRANDNEEFTTLDGQQRKLDSSMLMICDGVKPIGIAGIMGGEESKITENVKDVLFEAACFDGTNVRISGKKLGLRTDAAAKFEKGLDPNNAQIAIDRACQLIEILGAGEVIGGMVDVYEGAKPPRIINFDYNNINKKLGTNISEEEMLSYLNKLELSYNPETKEVSIPTFRQDLECFADLVEEVARFYGYDSIPTTLPTGEATIGTLSFKRRIEAIARNVSEQNGFSESMSYSFESPKAFDKLLIDKDSHIRKAITISNPLGEDFSIMRTISLNGILTSLSTNYNRRNKFAGLYEIANIYIPKQLPLTELPEEKTCLTLGMYGKEMGDFFNLKGVIEELFEKMGLLELITYNPKSGKPFLHPGRQANIIYNDTIVGYLGEIHPEVADNYHIGTETYIAVLDIPELVNFATFNRKYKEIAKYPAITRDISMTVPKEIMVGEIEALIRKNGGNFLESYHLFDVYEGSQIKSGYKSIAYSIVFRAIDRTLEDKDVNEVMTKILNELQKIGIELRQA